MYNTVFKLHAELLKAMSHPKRLEVIHLLRDQELSVGEIQQMLDLPQANLSQHLMVMRDAGIVETRKDGKQVYYAVTHHNVIKASDLLRELLIENHKDTKLEDEFLREMSDLVPLTHDPVCKMRISPKTAGFATSHGGKKYYFCASGCLEAFKKSPDKYQITKNKS